MQTPLIPSNEKERLEALKSFNILDTLPEEIFDDFTFLATTICGTGISLISLIDENRQWFKSKVGVDVTETPRDISFCGHAIHGDDIFEVPDALSDERFIGNPLIMGQPHIRFYASMPITTKDGYNLGTICVIDQQPRKLNDAQRNALKRIARQIMLQLELRVAKVTINNLNEQLSSKLNFIEKLTDNVPAFISYWDQNLICLFANKRLENFLNLTQSKLIGKHYYEVFPEDYLEQARPKLVNVQKGQRQSFESSRVWPNIGPEMRHGLINYLPDMNEAGQFVGFFSVTFDITKIKSTEKKLSLREKALNSSSEAILITDEQHNIVYVNSGFTKKIGYTEAEVLGKKTKLLNSNRHDIYFYKKMYQAIEINGHWQGEIINQHKEGKELTCLTTIDTIHDDAGKATHYVASLIDITEKQEDKTNLAILSAMLKRTEQIAQIGGWEYDWQTEEMIWSDQMFSIYELDHFKIPDFESTISFYQVEAREIIKHAFDECIETGKPWDLELPLTTAKGTSIWVRTRGEVVKVNDEQFKVVGTCQDITTRIFQEQQTLNREIALRNSLIREVHHHIKNSIQGISGILFNAAHNNPPLQAPIHDAVSKLNSIAVIHGLQGKNIDREIELSELLEAISHNINSVFQIQVNLLKNENWMKCHLNRNESVPIALILNELITNALKHGEKNSPIEISITQIEKSNRLKTEVVISITNIGEFKAKHATERGDLSHNGLISVSSLMPKTGARLSFNLCDNQSTVFLALKQPIVNFC